MTTQLKLLATGQIIPTALHLEMERSYLEYAMSVIVGRALPDVRDGLKPVHRRILYAMYELGLTPDRPFRKCARVVGDVLGKYHPHGDQSVYDALVRLVQDFSSRYPLLSGHGNFGSVDNDPPAAMRYTETRLAPIAMGATLQGISEAIVDFTSNFDNSQQEPTVLPTQLPILLLNGCSGIAVGMATNIPPHNLSEVVDGLIALIDKADLTDAELWRYSWP
jgi:DNA gyrase subunit A